jgi:hypothetical protein
VDVIAHFTSAELPGTIAIFLAGVGLGAGGVFRLLTRSRSR